MDFSYVLMSVYKYVIYLSRVRACASMRVWNMSVLKCESKAPYFIWSTDYYILC